MNRTYILVCIGVVALMSCGEGSKDGDGTLIECGGTVTCPNGLDCINDFCLRPGFLGDSCRSNDVYCVQGTCSDGVCKASGLPTDPIACSASKQCAAGYECKNDYCQIPAEIGQACSANIAYCVRGMCIEDKCVLQVGPGQRCDAVNICTANYVCNNGVCHRPVLEGGDCRSSVTFCQQGNCIEGKCVGGGGNPGDCKDTDGDTIGDMWDRCDVDTDGDTVPDCMDLDSDGDGIPDALEAYNGGNPCVEPMDSDGDGIYDFLSLDSDGNGIPDSVEGIRIELVEDEQGNITERIVYIDTDGDTILDSSSIDNDGDGILDIEEIAGIPHRKYLEFGPGGPRAADCNNDTIPDEPGTPDKPFDCDGDTVPDYLSFDSDGDTILDSFEFLYDSDGDGFLDRYSQDSDGDGIPDSIERGDGEWPVASLGNSVPDFRNPDIDGDGLMDGYEVYCEGLGRHSKFYKDVDGDGSSDGAEFAAELYAMADPESPYFGRTEHGFLMCDPTVSVTDVFDFYFELPYLGEEAVGIQGDEDSDILNFVPEVSKLDVVFNLDTTNSMGGEVANLKERIRDFIIPEVRARVSDSAFGVSRFDDFPTRGTYGSVYDYVPGAGVRYGYGRATDRDVPFELLGAVSTNDEEVIANVNKYVLHNGGDLAESGYESLWQIVMGDDKTKVQASWRQYGDFAEFSSGVIPYITVVAPDRWGGASFRNATLPVVVHITDAPSHDEKHQPYDPAYVENPHYSSAVHAAYNEKGARIISIYRLDGSQLDQLVETSRETKAYVPVCAFKDFGGGWNCGDGKCCTTTDTSGNVVGIDPVDDQCVLSFGISDSSALSVSLVDGVDAIVKYSSYQIAAVVRGELIPDSVYDTSCFIKRVEAFTHLPELGVYGYVAPPQEPEASCNPIARPAQFDGAGYNNGFENFATGTSISTRPGSQLNFRVIAENDVCAKPKRQAQVFKAYIDLIDPVTKMNFGTRHVSIVVPGSPVSSIN